VIALQTIVRRQTLQMRRALWIQPTRGINKNAHLKINNSDKHNSIMIQYKKTTDTMI